MPVAGQAITVRVKGGTVQPLGAASDPSDDIVHFQVLRPAGGGSWKVVTTSEDYRLPVIGAGADANTVTSFNSSFLCVQPGDRISLSTVGGFDQVKFPQGVPFQTFGRVPGAGTFTFAADGASGIDNDSTLPADRVQTSDGVELLMQVVVGSGTQARPACGGTATRPDPGAGPDTPDAPAGGGGSGTPTKPLRPKTTAVLKTRRLDAKGRVAAKLRCRVEGMACAGKVTLRARKQAIGTARYSLARGASGTVLVKLTKRGRTFLRKSSGGTMRTAVVLTTKGGISKGGTFTVKPRKG